MIEELKKHLSTYLSEPADNEPDAEELNTIQLIIGAELEILNPSLPLPLRTAGYWNLNGDGHLVYEMPDLGVRIRHHDRDLWVVVSDQPKGARQWVGWSLPVDITRDEQVMLAVARAAAHYEKQTTLQPYIYFGPVAFEGSSMNSAKEAADEAIQKFNEYVANAREVGMVARNVITRYQAVGNEGYINHYVIVTATMEDM